MDRDAALAMLAQVQAEYMATVAAIEEANRRLDALLEIMSGLERLFPDLQGLPTVERSTKRPKGQAAVSAVLRTYPGEWLTVGRVVHELEARGWLPESEEPANATRTALERLIVSEPGMFKKQQDLSGQVTYACVPPWGDLLLDPGAPGVALGEAPLDAFHPFKGGP